jgi:prefoldin subunit 5
MAVLYGHAIHSLRSDDDHEPEGVVKSSDVHSRLDSYSASLQNQQGQIDRLSSKVDTLTRNVTPLSTQLHALRQSLDALTTTLSSFETRLALIDTRLTTVEQGQESSFTELQTNLHTIIAGVREAMVRELIRELSPLIEQTGNSSARASLPTPSGRSASTSGRQETVKQPADPQKTKWVRTGDTRKPNTPGNEGGRVDTQERDSINSRKIINLSTGNGGDSRSRQSQAEVIAYILDFFHRERREPTLSEIINTTGCAKQTAVNSRNSARETFQQEKECMASASQL